MSETFRLIQALVARCEVEVSRHGLRELASDDILLDDIVRNIATARVVEDYRDAWKGPSVLVLQQDVSGRPVHVLWGMARGTTTPAVLVTAYRPAPELWTVDFMRRR